MSSAKKSAKRQEKKNNINKLSYRRPNSFFFFSYFIFYYYLFFFFWEGKTHENTVLWCTPANNGTGVCAGAAGRHDLVYMKERKICSGYRI